MATLPRTFVSFSSADIGYYYMMCAWKAHEHIDFNFADFQLEESIKSNNSYYIRSKCAVKIRRSDTFVLLIGADTFMKTEFVKPEVEAAVDKGCRLIGVNLNDCRFPDAFRPWFFMGKGALYVPYSSRILAQALKPWQRPGGESSLTSGDWYFVDWVYAALGYQLIGDTAVLPPPANPFESGRPPWAK